MSEELGGVERHANIPSLLTITKIKPNPNQKCVWHFDVWYFIEVDKNKFLPKKENLETEFIEMKWLSTHEAFENVSDPNTKRVLKIMKQRFKSN